MRVPPSAELGVDASSRGPFATADEALAFLATRLNVETSRPASLDVPRVFTLDRIAALLAALGNVHRSFRSVHVAGSKGKGSVCEMTASCLEACGHTVGLYTSPHLVSPLERIRINQRQIPGREFAGIVSRLAAAEADLPASLGPLTHFELMTAAAFVHFAEQAVDLAVIEVGLGGKRDATNIITPEVCAITAIQPEHLDVLGGTIESVAAEKAGIMKPGVPAVTIPQKPEVMAVLRAAAAAAGAPLAVLGEDLEFTSRFEQIRPGMGPCAKVVLTTARSSFEHLVVPLKGEHQAPNCGLALAIIDALRASGLDAPETKVAQGLERTPANGRLESVCDRPRIIIDGAHTPESVRQVLRALGAQVRYDSLVVVFGCAADKDAPGMIAALAGGADKLIVTRSESPRAADPRELLRRCQEREIKMAQAAPGVREAVNLAARAVTRDDLILVTGSFAVAGEAKRLLLDAARRPPAP